MINGGKTAITVLLFALLTSETCNKNVAGKVSITFTETQTYCGGAAPPDELVQRLRTPKPYQKGKIYLMDSERTCVDSFDSKQDSILHTFLSPGQYSLRLVREISQITETEERRKCVQEWNQRSLKDFAIVGGDTSMTLNIHFDCNPCYPPPP